MIARMLADSSGMIGGLSIIGGVLVTLAGTYVGEAVRKARTDRASTTRDREVAAAMGRHPAGSRR